MSPLSAHSWIFQPDGSAQASDYPSLILGIVENGAVQHSTSHPELRDHAIWFHSQVDDQSGMKVITKLFPSMEKAEF
jgi:hypothetical protein